MWIDVAGFGAQCHFLPEAICALTEAAVLLEKHERVFFGCREQLFAQTGDPWETLDDLAATAGIHPYTVHQLFLIYCADETYAWYQAAGHTQALYWDAMKDLKYKMEETHQIYGVWGVYCGRWLSSFILLKCFCLGRLQFEILPSEFHYELAGCTLQPRDPVVTVHIPSFGRLDYGEVVDAYSRAAQFFAPRFPTGAVWFHCETWILCPEVNELLPEGNLKRFSRDFHIVRACVDPNVDDRYRVFMQMPGVPVADYPEKNTLQRNLKAWLLEGNQMGLGFGLFLWKNGEIVSTE